MADCNYQSITADRHGKKSLYFTTPLYFLIIIFLATLSLAEAPDKSGVKPSKISLPSGAGSIEGLGESFEPQLNTGSTTYGVGITVPPGRAGLEPKIRLGYNSNTGNSMVGLGWTLDFPSIKRQTDKGFPSYTDADTFLFGGEELVPLSSADNDWRCENESDFKRFRQIDTNNDFMVDAWEMTDRDGTRHIFGQYRGAGNRYSVVVHSNPPPLAYRDFDKTYCWALNTTIDLHGNTIDYYYDNPAGVPGSAGLLYPQSVRYSVLNGNHHEILFSYEDREDSFEDYRATFAIITGKRLRAIEVHSHYAGTDYLVRSYQLEYVYRAEDFVTIPPGSLDLGISLLKRVVQLDRSGTGNNYMPPLIFEYSYLNLENAVLNHLDVPPSIEIGDPSGNVQIADIDGDSLPDIFETEDYWQQAILNYGSVKNGSTGQIDLMFSDTVILNPSSSILLSQTSANLMDYDGDGLTDYVLIGGSGAERRLDVYGNLSRLDRVDTVPPGVSSVRTKRLSNAPAAIAFNDNSMRQMDVNFDKISDFIANDAVSLGRFQYYYTDATGTWFSLTKSFTADQSVFKTGLQFAISGESNAHVQLADMNGDRLLDLVYLDYYPGFSETMTVRYWPYQALGEWAAGREMIPANGDTFQVDTLDPRDVLVQDMTGDGLADIAIVHGGSTTSCLELRVNIAGQRWSQPFSKSDLPRHVPQDPASPTTFRQADLNANGSTDLIWRNLGMTPSWDWLDIMPNGKPSLMTKIDNNLGKVTRITYGNAVEDWMRASNEGHPWRTKSPTSLHVVRRIRSTCGLDLDGREDTGVTTDQYVSEFQYRDAYYDSFEREFRGFAFAQRIDYGDDFAWDEAAQEMVRSGGWNQSHTPTGQLSGPTLVTRFRYLTGASDRADNDAGQYPGGWTEPYFLDEVTPLGGREEEILKGRQIWEEKLDPWALHDPTGNGDFDLGCYLAATQSSVNAMTPNEYVYTRTRQAWTVRRLYRPFEQLPMWVDMNQDGTLEAWLPDPNGNPQPATLSPPGRFASANPAIHVMNGIGKTVSFAFISQIETETIEANGMMNAVYGYSPKSPVTTLKNQEYDDYGNQTRTEDYGVSSDATLNDERFTVTEYALEGEARPRWIISKPAAVTVTDENALFVSQTKTYYDGGSFQGLGLGVMGSRALVHRTEKVVTGAGSLPAITEPSDRPGDPRLAANTTIDESRSAYDAFGNVITMLDPLGTAGNPSAGHARTIAYDDTLASYPVQEIIFLGDSKDSLVMSAAYDYGFGVVVSSTDYNDNVTTYEYDSFARLVAVVKPGDSSLSPTLLFEYLPADPTRSRVYEYDRSGALTVISSGMEVPSNRVVSRLREETGADGTHLTVTYTDGCGRELLKIKEGESSGKWVITSAKSYNHRQSAQSTWQPFDINGGETPPHFGLMWPGGRPPLQDLEGNTVVKSDTLFDPIGREISIINPPETIDDIGNEGARTRNWTRILPLENHIYDENDLAQGSPFQDTPMVNLSDGLGRLVEVQERVRLNDDGTSGSSVNTWTTTYQYDLNDKLIHITDSQNNEKWMRYDGLGRKIFMNDMDRSVMTYTFDNGSNLIETVDAKNQQTTYTYDGVNRLLTEDYHDEGLPFSFNRSYDPQQPIGGTNMPDVAYYYDTTVTSLDLGDGTTGTATNTKGYLSYIVDLSGEEHNSYDTRSRVAYTVKRIPDLRHDVLASYTTRYAYDSMDRVRTLIYPDNDWVSYTYNDRNLLQGISGSVAGDLISGLSFKASDQIEQCTYGNGVRTRQTYDPRLRLNSLLTHRISDPDNPLISFAYSFDGVSNITAIADGRPESVLPNGSVRRNTQTFQYDDLYRITGVQYSFNLPGEPAEDNGHIQYRYDRVGNMLAKTSDITHEEHGKSVTNLGDMSYGAASGAWNRVGRSPGDAPGPHALTGADNGSDTRVYPYDDNGNMTDIDELTCTWDFKDRLVAAENAEMRAVYTYDYTDRRITKKVTPKTNSDRPLTTSYIDKYFEIREFDQPLKYVFSGDTRVARITGTLTTTAQRVQRFRVFAGWNLLSMAVQASDAVGQLGMGSGPDIEAVAKWNATTREYELLGASDSLPAGSVFWLKSLSDRVLEVTGTYADPADVSIPAGGDYVHCTGLEAADLLPFNDTTEVRMYDTVTGRWLSMYVDEAGTESDLPDIMAPGDAIYVATANTSELQIGDPDLRIRYYHQDHLGSSSVVADASGDLVEETAFYPFGHPRNEYQPLEVVENYKFTQKEKDKESGLHYFEARFYTSVVGRFLSVDPLCERKLSESKDYLIRTNNYIYCSNNPTDKIDPGGMEEKPLTDACSASENESSSKIQTMMKSYNEKYAFEQTRPELKDEKTLALEKGSQYKAISSQQYVQNQNATNAYTRKIQSEKKATDLARSAALTSVAILVPASAPFIMAMGLAQAGASMTEATSGSYLDVPVMVKTATQVAVDLTPLGAIPMASDVSSDLAGGLVSEMGTGLVPKD